MGDFLKVDAGFGGEAALAELTEKAGALGIRIMLDGVFNHVGDNSLYFNKYGAYPSLGAYQSEASPYSSWFAFYRFPDLYDCWWGVTNLPKIRKTPEYRAFIAEQVKMRMPTLFLPLNPLDSRWLQMYNTFRKNHTVCRIVFYSREVKGYLLSEVVKEE